MMSSQTRSSPHAGGASKSCQALLHGFATVEPHQDCDIAGLSLDSRCVNPGDLFIAVPGIAHDGRDHIQQAIEKGAVAVACEKDKDKNDNTREPNQNLAVPSFSITDLAQHISDIAARFFDHPSAHMQLVGITGTNGKTTCAYLIAQALDLLGQRCALMSTLGAGFIDALQPAPHSLTTADAITTQRTLASLLARKAAAVCVEVSSHALQQGRVNRVAFDIALFTNLSHDHLDYHGDMAHYARAKRRLFEFDGLSCAVINADDAFGRQLLDEGTRAARCISYGVHGGDLCARHLELNENGIAFEVEYAGQCAPVRSTLIGAVNVPNLLAAIAALIGCGYDLEQIAAGVGHWRAPPGRMELLRNLPSQPAVIVDYAHTPDALERTLASLAELAKGELWVVFGCGGDRDRSKRAPMGRVAETLADRVIVTDDNPRNEDPQRIAGEIIGAMKTKATVMHDRRRAIKTAIKTAAADDIVLIAGKGHEATQTIGEQVINLSDRDIVANALAEGRP